MSQGIVLTLSMKTRHLVMGRIGALLVIGVLSGLAVHYDKVSDHQRGLSLTLAQYTADFGVYRDKLIRDNWPLWGHVLLMIGFLALFVGVYELLSLAIAWILDRTLGRRPPDAALPNVAA